MAKKRGKKLRDKGQTISRPEGDKKMIVKKKVSNRKATNAVHPASPSHPSQALAYAPATNGSRTVSRGKEKDIDKLERLSGFIFMCNAKTKPECFAYRVFGLPAGKKEVVEKIKAGTKLFLFDFDLKLLYGVYKASHHGHLNLEASAFGGKFPAQVRFVIYKDRLPLPESVFRRAIKDNYQGSKFTPELSGRQVRDLLLLFRPCVASTAAPLAPMPEVAPPRTILRSALEDQYQPSVRLPPTEEDPYLARMQHGRPAPMIEPHSMQHRVVISRREYYGTEATMDRVYPTMERQGVLALNDPYYVPEDRRPYPYAVEHQGALAPHDPYYVPEDRLPYHYTAEDTAQIVQEHYLRYRAVQEMVPRDRLIGVERDYYQLPSHREREFDPQQENVTAGYHYPTPATSHVPPPMHPHGPVAARNGPVSSYYSFAGARQLYR